MKSLLFIFLLSFLCLRVQISAHEDEAHDEPKITDNVSVEKDGYRLSLRLVPQRMLRVAAKSAAMADVAFNTQASPAGKTHVAQVGDLAFLIAELEKDGQAVRNVRYKMKFHHVEDDKDVFSVSLISPNGTMNWGQQFFDGAIHTVFLEVEPVEAGTFVPVKVQMNVGVIGIQPPAAVVIRSIFLLLLVAALAMAAGYILTYYLARGGAPKDKGANLDGAVLQRGHMNK